MHVFILYFLVNKSISGWQIINISASRYSISASRYNIPAFEASDMSIIARLAGYYGDNRPTSVPVQNFVSRYETSTLK